MVGSGFYEWGDKVNAAWGVREGAEQEELAVV